MSDELEVLDLSARPPYPERKHEILAGSDGQTVIYTFKHGERLTMPFEHGCIFMNNPGFHVFEPGASKPYDPTPKPDTPKLTLPEGMVVASLDELTQESLVVRANKAGANMPKSTKKVELSISFAGRRRKSICRKAMKATIWSRTLPASRRFRNMS